MSPRPRPIAAVALALVVVALAAAGLSGAIRLGPDTAAFASPSRPIAVASPSPAATAGAPGGSARAPSSTSPSTTAPPATTAETFASRLPAVLDALRAKARIPGASVSIVFPDGSVWTGTSGLADIAARKPVTAQTEFAIASMSKTFTAATVLELAAEGRIGLDMSAAGYVPGIRLDPAITVRELLDHTSGLDDYFLNPKIDVVLQAAPRARWTAARALSYVGKPYFPPGKGWHYSNTNYLVLGLLVERVTGRSLAAELRSRFFDPLHLDSSYVQVAEAARGPTAHGYRLVGSTSASRPIDVSDGSTVMPFTSVVTAAGGAGAVASTSADVARWGWLLYGGRVLAPSSYEQMLGDVANVSPYRPRVPYGMGVQEVVVDGLTTLGHSGRLLGFRGVVRYVPDADISIAMLTNQNRFDPAPIAAELLRLVLPPPGVCMTCPEPR